MAVRQQVHREVAERLERTDLAAQTRATLLLLAEAQAWAARKPRDARRATVDQQLRPTDRRF